MSSRGWRLRALVIAAMVSMVAGCVGPGFSGAQGGGHLAGLEGEPAEAYRFYGIPLVSGVAGAGLPVVPLSVDENGSLTGEPLAPGLSPIRDVLSWFRYCGLESSPALDSEAARDNRLRYHVATGSPAEHPWWEARAGEPVHPDDLAPGQAARVTWRSEGLPADEALILWVMRLPEGEMAPEFRGPPYREAAWAHDGIVAFSARSTESCTLVDPVTQLEGGLANATRVPGLDEPALVVDPLHEGAAWNPRWVVLDVMVPDWQELGYEVQGLEVGCGHRFWYGFAEDAYRVAPGGELTTTFRVMTADAAFRNLTWHAFLANGTGTGWVDRTATFSVEGPDRVGPNETATFQVEVRVPEDLPERPAIGLAWEGGVLACEDRWRPFAPPNAASRTLASLEVDA